MLAIDIVISCCAAIITLLCSYKMFQIFQLSAYKSAPVASWFKNTNFDYMIRYFSLSFLSFVGMFVFVSCFSAYEIAQYFGLLFFVLFAAVFIFAIVKEQKKTPLKITPRIIRTAILFAVLCALIAFGLLRLGEILLIGYSLIAILFLIIPFVCLISFVVLSPIERLINKGYIKKARLKLDGIEGLRRIGITGSFGKTTAKNILSKMLETKFKTASSPQSFNTPMGLCRYINNDMPHDSEVLIAEMGARHVGDIAELVQFIQPQYALITSVGNQHLDTFGSLENVIKTKFELVEGIGADGIAVFNGESDEVVGMFNRCNAKKFICGKNEDGKKLDASYSNLKISGEGTCFDLCVGNDSVTIKTKLLGKHIAGMICACARLSVELGVTLKDISRACEALKPVPHRLELIQNGDTTVLDDAYNSNLDGAKSALEVLNCLEGTKIIITPGFVELGEREAELNSVLGEAIAETNIDFAYLVGSRAKDIKAGCVKAGISEDKVKVFATLDLAVKELAKIEGKKAVLFENDLPDNY